MVLVDRRSEIDLIARLRVGDTAAFDEVHDALNGRLFGFLARLARNRDVAEDLLEETWLRLVQHANRLDPDTRLAPWLFTVARNLYISYCRSRSLEESSVGIGLWPVAPSPPSPFEAAAGSEFGRHLEAALASLPAVSREVLLLVGAEGMTPSEAAHVCGVTPETMRQRLSRARALLAARLGEARARQVAILKEVAS